MGNIKENKSTNQIIRLWKWWFTPRSIDLTVTYRERALRVLLPTFLLLRLFAAIGKHFANSGFSEPYAPEWLSVLFFVVPILVSFYFLLRQKVNWAGTFFVLHWFLVDLLSLPSEGYWYAGFQISLIIQVILAALLLSSRGMLYFLVIQLVTFGTWGHWLDLNYYDPPLLSSGQPVAVFWRTIVTLGFQETIILFIVRYLRLEMEKSLRLQKDNIGKLEIQVNERQRTEARLRSIFSNSPDFIMEMDRDGTVLFANRRVEEYVGTQIYRYLPSDSIKRVEEIVVRAYETGKPQIFEIQLFEDDGSLQWYSIRLGPVISEGMVDRLVVISTNIHAQKEAEIQVKQRAVQLATIVEIGHAVSNLKDLDEVLEIIYQQIQRIAPVDTFFICLLGDDKKQLEFPITYDMGVRYKETGAQLRPESRLGKVILTGKPFRLHRTAEEVVEAEKEGIKGGVGDAKRSSGSLLFLPLHDALEAFGVLSIQSYELNAYPDELVETLSGIADQGAIAIQNARLYTNLQRELAERKRIEVVREKLISELEQKNAELERFTYTVSHDLRSPIVTIMGFVGMLEEDLREHRPERVQSDLQRIAGAAGKMDALLRDLLELSRIGRLVNPPDEIDTLQLIHDALETVNAQIRSRNVKVEIASNLPRLYGDYIRLREVFENLIGNAAKYMGDQTSPLIEIGINAHKNEPAFYVKDNGMGIDPQYHNRIFNLFEKLNPAIEGTGIGLTLVKRIVEYHGGTIWVESEGLGKGSTFCFTVPDERTKNDRS